MDPEYITKKELQIQVPELLKNATLAQYKCVYAYLKDLDEWPIVVDEVKINKEEIPKVSGYTYNTGEECPF